MSESFEINEYNFKDAKSDLKMAIYSRTEEFALKILEIANTLSPIEWRKIEGNRYCQHITINLPPYEVEQNQLAVAEKNLEKRRKHHGN